MARIHELLGKYKKVGVDFDDTLIDNRNSPLLWDYISTNPFNQQFFIVSFRSGGMEKGIFADLAHRGSSLTVRDFVGVHTIDHSLWRDHHLLPRDQRLILSLAELSDDPYMLWKGLTCSEQGIEVLIDDMTDNVIQGCRKHGVVHFHPDDLA